MKKKLKIILIMAFSVVFCACTRGENKRTAYSNGSGAAVSGTATESAASADPAEEVNQSDDDLDIMVFMAKKNKPMLSKKVDLTQKGIELVCNSEFATGPIKGDDGNCYYYRKERKKRGRITFYRNNAIKVCETVLPEKYEKNYFITAFLKQGERFWVQFVSYESNREYLVPVQIKDGKWGKGIKIEGERVIYYKGCFYTFFRNDGMVDITDQKGNTKSLKYEKDEKWATLQTIIDDKLYYIIDERDSINSTVMRCDMDGSHKEKLFQYNRVSSTSMNNCNLSMEGDFLYLFDPYCDFMLTRIPLYGGEAEKIIATDWYELTEDSIYYLDGAGKISRIDKDLNGRPEFVMQADKDLMGNTFFCTDGYLMVEIYNKEELNKLETIWKAESNEDYYDINMNYSNQYYWVSEKGKVEDTIPGSGFGRKYQDWYELSLEYLDKYGEAEE